MPEKILTTPPALDDYQPYHLTGNEYISLPLINPSDGGIEALNLIHFQANGLLQFAGDKEQPLLHPVVRVEGLLLDFHNRLEWFYLEDWLPAFKLETGDFLLEGLIFAPPGHRGFIYRIKFTNYKQTLPVELGLEGRWQTVEHLTYHGRKLAGNKSLAFDPWTESLTLEFNAPYPLAALAVGSETPGTVTGEANEYYVHTRYLSERYSAVTASFFVCTAPTADGAGATLIDLRRRSSNKLFNETLSWLEKRKLKLKRPSLESLFQRNLFFNYFFAQGLALDTEDRVMLTSRSPRYYVSGAYWPRDTLLWSFPAVLLLDSGTARDILLAAFTRHLKNAGIHSHYLNGTVLAPGFELDQISAYCLALEIYLKTTNDLSLLKEACIEKGLPLLLHRLWQFKHPRQSVFSTFLDPADDPATYPYLTYDNALAWRALLFMDAAGLSTPDGGNLNRTADALFHLLQEHAVVQGPFGPMWAWSFDLEGNYELYDNPPGSLKLLAYYEFTAPDDPVFLNTLTWIHSSHNPYYYPAGDFPGVGCAHARFPWTLNLANDLLLGYGGKTAAVLENIYMDNGLACESFDPESGKAKTGLAFATCAGFLAYAVWQAFGEIQETGSKNSNL